MGVEELTFRAAFAYQRSVEGVARALGWNRVPQGEYEPIPPVRKVSEPPELAYVHDAAKRCAESSLEIIAAIDAGRSIDDSVNKYRIARREALDMENRPGMRTYRVELEAQRGEAEARQAAINRNMERMRTSEYPALYMKWRQARLSGMAFILAMAYNLLSPTEPEDVLPRILLSNALLGGLIMSGAALHNVAIQNYRSLRRASGEE